MARKFKFSQEQALPLVFARIKGKQKSQRIKLVFDTGAFMTQINTAIVEEIGYSARDGLNSILVSGPSGPIDEGYSLKVAEMEVLGKRFSPLAVAAYDFCNLETEGIAGLLGFDVIRQLHLEMNGAKGELVIF